VNLRTFLNSFSKLPFHALLLLSLQTRIALQPTFGRIIWDLLAVLLQISKKICHTTNSTLFAVIRRAIARRDVAERWTRLEERQQVGRELVGHFSTFPFLFHQGKKKKRKENDLLWANTQVRFGDAFICADSTWKGFGNRFFVSLFVFVSLNSGPGKLRRALEVDF
jgi:hypothetical protein